MTLFVTDHPTVLGGDPSETMPSAASSAPLVPGREDRRDLRTRKALVQRVAGEFHEIPGLCLTLPQAARFFGLAEASCERILSDLVEGGVIQRAGNYYGIWRTEFIGAGFLIRNRYLW
jgi:hypothetical protein